MMKTNLIIGIASVLTLEGGILEFMICFIIVAEIVDWIGRK